MPVAQVGILAVALWKLNLINVTGIAKRIGHFATVIRLKNNRGRYDSSLCFPGGA
jgi:hypothetical protein